MIIKDLCVSYDNEIILENINLSFEKPQLCFVLGLNGSGKTTLLKSIMGITAKKSGEIIINDNSKLSIKERAKLLSYLPQNPSYLLDYSVIDFISLGITPHLSFFEMPNSAHIKNAEKSMIALNILHLKDKKISKLSGGQLQLALLARCIVQNSQYLLLDEANANLDFKAQHEFLNTLKNYVKLSQKTAIVSVHDPNLALKFADRILFIYNKKIFADISSSDNSFKNEFERILNIIYDGSIELIENQDADFINWRD